MLWFMLWNSLKRSQLTVSISWGLTYTVRRSLRRLSVSNVAINNYAILVVHSPSPLALRPRSHLGGYAVRRREAYPTDRRAMGYQTISCTDHTRPGQQVAWHPVTHWEGQQKFVVCTWLTRVRSFTHDYGHLACPSVQETSLFIWKFYFVSGTCLWHLRNSTGGWWT